MISTTVNEEIRVYGEGFVLPGELEIPQGSSSLVLFSHGSGSSRLSSRNQLVAQHLRDHGIGTFLFDLLAAREDNVQARFDISLLTERLSFVTGWILKQRYTKDLNIGYFGASTGAASALKAAAKMGQQIKAVVSRGGRPDLAMPIIAKVKAATLLLVGGLDTNVLELNRQAFERLRGPKELKVIDDAGHLFEEPGKLEEVADEASNWFSRYLI
jgi:pimeloyl-ACP methyl ester carboxylesterase